MNLYGNELSGEIPEELYSLPELSYLNLGVNNLSGELSPKIAGLSKLTGLWLNSNNFSGPLPKELGQMNLIQVGLNDNSFSGSLPDELGTLNNLEIFRLAANEFSGIIPISILNNPNIWDKFWGQLQPIIILIFPLLPISRHLTLRSMMWKETALIWERNTQQTNTRYCIHGNPGVLMLQRFILH